MKRYTFIVETLRDNLGLFSVNADGLEEARAMVYYLISKKIKKKECFIKIKIHSIEWKV